MVTQRSNGNKAEVTAAVPTTPHAQIAVAGIVDGPAQRQADAAGDQSIADVAGVGDLAGEPFELGDHQGVAGAHGRLRLVQAGPGAVSACEDLALGGEVLQDG